jgi:hypothetical protein
MVESITDFINQHGASAAWAFVLVRFITGYWSHRIAVVHADLQRDIARIEAEQPGRGG